MDIDKLKTHILDDLQRAIELELLTIPPYLTAYFSIKPKTNTVVANIIRSVFMEEMLHICLAGNIMVSLGGHVRLGPENIPKYPVILGFRNREFEIGLTRLCPQSIHIFRRLELPDEMPPLEEFVDLMEDVSIEGYSIGDFYNHIRENINELHKACHQQGKTLFNPDPSNQITETYFWGARGKPIAVVDIDSANLALDEIIDQGEGGTCTIFEDNQQDCSLPPEPSHFYKFSEVYYQQKYQLDDDPFKPPTGKEFKVHYDKVYPIKKNCKQKDFKNNPELAALNNKFNENYTLMLKQIEEAFNGNPKALYTSIMNGMHGLTPVAQAMVKMKIDPFDPKSPTGSPSFEWVEPI